MKGRKRDIKQGDGSTDLEPEKKSWMERFVTWYLYFISGAKKR